MDLGQRNKIAPIGNMSSMTDLVFLLLIFFIILSTMVVNGEQVNLPQSNGEPHQGSKISLTINKELRYFIGTDEIEKDRMELRLKALMQGEDSQTIVLNVDKDVPTGETIEVLSLAKTNGWSIVVATKNKKS